MSELKEPAIFAFSPPIKERNPKSVIIFSGGGYSKLTYDEDAFQIAKWMNTQGISAFILNLSRITQILTNNCAKIKSAKSV